MVKFEQRDPGKLLDETANSINKIVEELDNKVSDDEVITKAEIRKIASQLQAHVRDLLAISINHHTRQSQVASEGSAADN